MKAKRVEFGGGRCRRDVEVVPGVHWTEIRRPDAPTEWVPRERVELIVWDTDPTGETF